MNKEKIKTVVDRFFVVLIAAISLLAVSGLVFEIGYLGKIYPGIRVGSIYAGGMTYAQLYSRLGIAGEQIGVFKLTWGVNQWEIEGNKLGLNIDTITTTRNAAAYGRSGNIITDLQHKIRLFQGEFVIQPEIIIDDQLLENEFQLVADQIDIPAREPEIKIENGAVQILVGENGQRTDIEQLKKKLYGLLGRLEDPTISVPVAEIKPKLSESQVANAKELAQATIGKKLMLQNEGENWEIGQDQLLSWIDLQSGQWSTTKIATWIDELAKTVDRPPQSATFHYVGSGKVEEFKPSKPGMKLEKDPTVEAILEGLITLSNPTPTETVIALVTSKVAPDVENSEVNSMGIRELIGKGESWYSGSITNRIFNLKKAAEAINGILVAPEEIFSFNRVVGEISASTGYKQAYIIKEGKTILGDGGGVCQVSSTLFRAMLAAGLPIEERVAHAYRVHYYEEKYQPGFDATVFQPSPDFKFKNDTGAHILIQTVYDEKEKYLAFEIYGTNDGRKVEISKARIWEVIAPPPDLYQDDSTLPIGKVVQTEHAAWGAKVAFDWKVVRGEEVLQERTFYSNYKSWQAVYLRGTKPI